MSDTFAQAREALRQADALLINAGAGFGVDSGLPDFRGDEGFWKAYPPFRKLGLSFVDLANPSWFKRDPALAWGFYGHRLQLYRQTTPHLGFQLLREASQRCRFGSFVFTSNVDGQFQKAGFPEERLFEVHGSIHHLQCTRFGCRSGIWPAVADVTVDVETMRAQAPFPTCPQCGALARPNILMFGDSQWLEDRSEAQEERLQRWLRLLKVERARLVIVELGAGLAVPTVRRFSEMSAQQFKAPLIRINPREAFGPAGTLSFEGGAASTLTALLGPSDA